MDSFSLYIAGHNLHFIRDIDAPPFDPSEILSEFMSDNNESGITITVFNKPLPEMIGEEELFTAPFIKESNDGSLVKKSDRFWSVFRMGNKKIIRVQDPETGNVESNLLFDHDSTEWKLYSNNKTICSDPFSYPLNGLILYYLSVKHKDLIVHASVVEYKNRGYLFSGVSGKGKTTVANLWEENGALIIHDDLVIISQKNDGSIIASSTPLNSNSFARNTRLDTIFIIEHFNGNLIARLKGTEAITSVMSNTIQHNYDKEIINDHIGKVMELVESVPVYKMRFTPDQKAVEAVLSLKVEGLKGLKVEELKGLRVERVDAIETVIAVLESGNSVELNSSGYSMFPTLMPGDRVIVKPLTEGEFPEPGSVVVCVENGTTAQRHNGAKGRKRRWGEWEKGREGDEEMGRLQNCVLVMHRLIDIKEDDSGKTLIIARGDSGIMNDEPWSQQQLLGVAASYKRGKKEHPLKTFIPGAWRYEYNRRLLWVFGKLKRVRGTKKV